MVGNYQEDVEQLPDLMAPQVDEEDIQAEAAILRWQGKNPNLSILRRRAAHYETLLFADNPGDCEEMVWGGGKEPGTPSLETLQGITDWTFHQSTQVQILVWEFMEEPDEVSLQKTLRQLRRLGLVGGSSTPPPASRESLSTAILHLLRQGPKTKEDLYQFAREFNPSKRPEAAVRQFLRRLDQAGKLKETNHGYALV